MKINSILKCLLTLFIVGFHFSINSQTIEKNRNESSFFWGHNLISSIDTSLKYNVFIPNHDQLLPAIILFDPHGKTEKVIEMYSTLAEKYKIALVGYDDSSNDTPFERTQNKFSPWLNEINNKYPLDSNRLFFLGFSGGARVASLLSYYESKIKGIGLCGAGGGDPYYWDSRDISIFGFCGTGDFNYREFIQMGQLKTQKAKYSFRLFHGKHEWPPQEIIEVFFQFVVNQQGQFKKIIEQEAIQSVLKENNWGRPDISISILQTAILAIQPDISDTLEKALKHSNSLVSDIFFHQYNSLIELENEEQLKLRMVFSQADTNRYKQWMDSLVKVEKIDSLGLEYDVNARLKSFAGILAYSFSKRAMEKNITNAYPLLRIYELTEPENTEMLFMMARYWAKKQECEKSKFYIKKYQENTKSMDRIHNTPEILNCLK